MGPMVLFAHLKIILLQYFSIFSFQLYPNGPLVLKVLLVHQSIFPSESVCIIR